uniref:Photosystem II reaction center protein Z n=2 Tax=Corallina TaxID=35169 RepID=A0A6M3WCC1_COROI|nr:photosystem II protein Z [Corallina officinalis]QJF58592.1 photosystem II protein Z [Corallina officinalis]QJF58791.1 photosystem II protein Z [Corallina officinalis]QJF58990.1 photosystem II protein Z [Corallina officinalis]
MNKFIINKKSMAIAVQLLVFGLILLSIVFVVLMPVTLASPGEWEKSKNIIYTGAGIWSILVIITGLANLFVA